MTLHHHPHRQHRPRPARVLAVAVTTALAVGSLVACGEDGADDRAEENPHYTTEPSDAFPLTVEHEYGETTIEAEPQRVVSVGLTEQDVLLELGVTPVATTEWYGEQEFAVWPWAADRLNGAEPEVLSAADGFQYERIAALEPDLIIGTNAGMDEDAYERLSEIAPTVTATEGSAGYASPWREQTRQIAAAVGRSAEGEDLIAGVEEAYAAVAAQHPEFAGRTATFAQGVIWEGVIYVYPDGVNTDFLTDLGFAITPGLEQHAPGPDQQAQISAENAGMLEADVVLFATESPEGVEEVLSFGTMATLPAVQEGRAIYTDAVLSGAIYFLTPLSQKYVLEHLEPRLVDALAGESPQDVEG